MNNQYNRIDLLLTSTCSPEFLEDMKDIYGISKEDLIFFIQRSGAEFILNKNLDFSISIPNLQLSKAVKITLRQNNAEIYSEMFDMKC